METQLRRSLKKVLGFLLATLSVVGAIYYYGVYQPALEDSKPPQIMSDSALQGLLIDKTTKFFKFEYSDVANFELMTDQNVDIPGSDESVSFYYSVKPISVEDILRSTYPVPGMRIAYADYSPDVEKMFHLYPDVSAHSNSRAITIEEGDDYIIPAFRGFALIASDDSKLYHPDLRSFEDVPTQEEIDVVRETVLENLVSAAGVCPEFPIPFEEKDWVLLPANDKTVFKKVMNCIQSNVGYEAQYIWYQTGVNTWERLDEEDVVLADEDTYLEIGESGYSMVWFKIGTYEIVAPEPDPDPDPEDPVDPVDPPVAPQVVMATYDEESLTKVMVTFNEEVQCDADAVECFEVYLNEGEGLPDEEYVVVGAEPLVTGLGLTANKEWEITVDHSFTLSRSYVVKALDLVKLAGTDVGVDPEHNTAEFSMPDPVEIVSPTVESAEALNKITIEVVFSMDVNCVGDADVCFRVTPVLDGNIEVVVIDAVPDGDFSGNYHKNWVVTVNPGIDSSIVGDDDKIYTVTALAGIKTEEGAGIALPDSATVNVVEFAPFATPSMESAIPEDIVISVAFDMAVKCGDGVEASDCMKVLSVDPLNPGDLIVTSIDPAAGCVVAYCENWLVTVNEEGVQIFPYDVSAPLMESEDGILVENSIEVSWPTPTPPPVQPEISSATIIDNGTAIDVVFNVPVKGDGFQSSYKWFLVTGEGTADLDVVGPIKNNCPIGPYCNSWTIHVDEIGLPDYDYKVKAPFMMSSDNLFVGNFAVVTWGEVVLPDPVLQSAVVQDNGTTILVSFDVGMRGQPGTSSDQWFTVTGDDGSVLTVVSDSPDPYGCINGADYCQLWLFEVNEAGSPFVVYDVAAPGMENVDGSVAGNSKEVTWEDEPLILIEADVLSGHKNIIGVAFSEPVSYSQESGSFEDIFVVTKNDDPEVVLDVLNAASFDTDNGCEDYPDCDVYLLELDQNLESDVEYLVVAKSSTDDSQHYLITYDGVSIDKDYNSGVVKTNYEDPFLTVSLSGNNPDGKTVNKGATEIYLAFDLLAENSDIAIDGFTFELRNEDDVQVDFNDFDQMEVFIDDDGGKASFGVAVPLADGEYFVDFMTGSDGGFVLPQDVGKEVFVKLKISEDAVVGNEHRIVLSGFHAVTTDVYLQGIPQSGELMMIGKDLVTLFVELAGNTPNGGFVEQGTFDHEYLYFDLTATGGPVEVSAIDVSRHHVLDSGVGDPSWNPTFNENFDSVEIAEISGADLGFGNFSFQNGGLACIEFNTPLSFIDGETKHLLVKADVSEEANVQTGDFFSVKQGSDVYTVESAQYDVSVVGAFPVNGNYYEIDLKELPILDIDIDPEYLSTDQPTDVFPGDVIPYTDIIFTASELSDITVTGLDLSLSSDDGLFDDFFVTVRGEDGHLVGAVDMSVSGYHSISFLDDVVVKAGDSEILSLEIVVDSEAEGLHDFTVFVVEIVCSDNVDLTGDFYVNGPMLRLLNSQVIAYNFEKYDVGEVEAGETYEYLSFELDSAYNDAEILGVELGVTGHLTNIKTIKLRANDYGPIAIVDVSQFDDNLISIPMNNLPYGQDKYTVPAQGSKKIYVEVVMEDDLYSDTVALKLNGPSSIITDLQDYLVFEDGVSSFSGNQIVPSKPILHVKSLTNASSTFDMTPGQTKNYMDLLLSAEYGDVEFGAIQIKGGSFGISSDYFDEIYVNYLNANGTLGAELTSDPPGRSLDVYGGSEQYVLLNTGGNILIEEGEPVKLRVRVKTNDYFNLSAFNMIQFGVIDFIFQGGSAVNGTLLDMETVFNEKTTKLWGPVIELSSN